MGRPLVSKKIAGNSSTTYSGTFVFRTDDFEKVSLGSIFHLFMFLFTQERVIHKQMNVSKMPPPRRNLPIALIFDPPSMGQMEEKFLGEKKEPRKKEKKKKKKNKMKKKKEKKKEKKKNS